MRALIVNPFASGVSEARLAAVQAALPADTETFLTQARGDATELAAEWSPRAEAIYVFSGDGTYNEVLNGLRADVPVGFLPGGGTSVLPARARPPARSRPRSRADPARQAAAHLTRPRQRADSSRSTPASGSTAELVRRVDELGRREDGKRPGDLAFGLAVARALARAALPLPGVARGGGARPGGVRTRRELLAVHLRGPRRAALRARTRPSRAASTSSRRVDVRAARIPRLAVQAVRGRPRPGFALLGHDLDRIVIRCDVPLPAQVDGEDIGDVEEAEIVAERDAVTVLVVGSTLPPWRTRSRSPTSARG